MTVDDFQLWISRWAKEKGWMDKEVPVPEQCALIHSEISEALEEFRNGHGANEVYFNGNKPEGYPVELADAVIRILHYASLSGFLLSKVLTDKMKYNETREYRHGGKVV